jgi:glycosyltransferase involved in cell wall biosynthesis
VRDGEHQVVGRGAFDDLTIMRYTHSYRDRSSGGVEQYLRCLNRGLLQRHRLTILQTHLVGDFGTAGIEVEKFGMGRILWIPVAFRQTQSRFTDLPSRARYVYEQTSRLGPQDGVGTKRAVVRAFLSHRLGHLRHRSVIISDHLSRLFMSYGVGLLSVHWLTYDTERLIRVAKRAGIPFTVTNHFDNGLFSEARMRKWLPLAAGVGAVSGRGVPEHVRSQCVNLLDAVDTEFFAPEKVPPEESPSRPLILLPALIKPGKGQSDLLRAARILAARNLDFQICFAGAVESPSLRQELQEYASTAGLEGRVAFLGELCQEEIRRYYALSSLVVLPTYWEGLGRSLVEAQAMHKPVVAYDSGGVGDTMLPNETGFLVKTGDIEAMADKIGFLLENEAQRRLMGERGRKFVVEKFSVDAFIQRHETFYLKALSRKNAAFRNGGAEPGNDHTRTPRPASMLPAKTREQST